MSARGKKGDEGIHFTLWMLACWLVWSFSITAPASAETRVSARVDRTRVGPGESLALQITIGDGKGEPDITGISDFKVIPRGTRSSVQIINSQMTQELIHSYLLIPLRQGRLTIPAVPVTVKGRVLRTEPIAITVAARSEKGPGDDRRSKDVWVTSGLSREDPYVGQQITYTFRLYNAVQINDASFQPPDFQAFSAKEIKDRRSYRKIINGRDYVVTEVHYILTPLSPGPVTIEPAALQVGILQRAPRQRRSPFDDFFNRGRVQTRVLQTEALQLQVRPLPPLEDVSTFSGLIGEFEIIAEVEKSDLKVGDSATLAVTIQGRGNVMDAQPPPLQIPQAFKTYADTPEEEINLNSSGYSGKKTFRTALVPVQAGDYEIPAVRLTYFDVRQNAYRTLSAAVPPLKVHPAATAEAAPVTITPAPLLPLKQRVEFTGRDILPPKQGLDAVQSHKPVSLAVFLLSLLGPAAAFGAAVMVQRLRTKDPSPRAVMKTKARQALKTARNSTEDDFLTHLYQALTAAILAAAGRTGEALTWKEAENLLLQSDCPSELARGAAELLSQIESSKFSGTRLSAHQRSRMLDQSHKMVRKLAP